jgi:hypothetical protein
MQLGQFDWGAIINSVGQGAAAIYSAKTVADQKLALLKAEAAARDLQAKQAALLSQQGHGASLQIPTFQSLTQPSMLVPIALGGAGLIALVLMMRRK